MVNSDLLLCCYMLLLNSRLHPSHEQLFMLATCKIWYFSVGLCMLTQALILAWMSIQDGNIDRVMQSSQSRVMWRSPDHTVYPLDSCAISIHYCLLQLMTSNPNVSLFKVSTVSDSSFLVPILSLPLRCCQGHICSHGGTPCSSAICGLIATHWCVLAERQSSRMSWVRL
jgi:hypothetical protein